MRRANESTRQKLRNAVPVILLLPIILPLAAIALLAFAVYRLCVYVLVWCLWLPKGKDALLVYSNSPVWGDYMLQEIVPLLGDRAIILNWSERKQWPLWSMSTVVFRAFAGAREFNPMVVVFRPWSRATFFRFWSAFKDFKHGDPTAVQALRRELEFYL
jgi:hypothetical protein